MEGICKNANNFNNEDYSIFVIGDVKTPVETRDYCEKLCRDFNSEVIYLDIEDQKNKFVDYIDLFNFIPLNNNTRKMIGTFLAYKSNCERVVMIDDDNYATDNDFIKFHSICGSEMEINCLKSSDGWFNICESMLEKNKIPFYPRGYPWSKRFQSNTKLEKYNKKSKIVVNGGLVLSDPDVDAVSRLFWPLEVTGIKDKYLNNFGLYPGTWSPFNDQNTSISRNLIPVYYKPPSVLRNADIWTSYLIERICEESKDIVTFGQQLVKQIGMNMIIGMTIH